MNRNAFALAAIVLAAIAASVAFTLTGHSIPDWVGAVALGGAGALGGIIIPGEGSSAAGVSELSNLAHHMATLLGGLVPHEPAGTVAAGSQTDASSPILPTPLPDPAPVTDAPPAAGT